MGVISNYWTYIDFLFDDNKGRAVAQAWSKVGVECRLTPIVSNQYYIDGQRVSRNEAIEYARKYRAENKQPAYF